MRRWLAAAATLAVGVAAVSGVASAHRGHSSLSVVEIDAATGAFSVTHRLAAHDVEPFLVRLAPEASPSLDDEAAMSALRAYAGRSFQVWDADGRPTGLTWQAEELSADDVRLIYRGRLPTPVTAVRIDSGLLQEGHDDQENQVNVRRGGVTRTLVFRAGSEPQTVDFEG